MKLPAHLCLFITHNEHEACYRKIEDYFKESPIFENADAKEIQECIQNNSIWEIQWYPRTPIGFNHVFASTLEKALSLANEPIKE